MSRRSTDSLICRSRARNCRAEDAAVGKGGKPSSPVHVITTEIVGPRCSDGVRLEHAKRRMKMIDEVRQDLRYGVRFTAPQLVRRQAGAKLLVGPVESSAAHLRRPGLAVLRE